MSAYDLIPEDAYDGLPDEPADKFVAIVRIAQSNLQRMLDDGDSRDFADEIRSQFMAIVQGSAEALGIEGLETQRIGFEYADYTRFQVILAGIVSRVRLIGDRLSKPHSVELGRVTREKIRQEIDQLRVYIDSADFSDSKKTSLNDKLDDLIAELDRRRLGFARTMAIAASIMGTVGGSTAAIANAPKITAGISYIISLIGIDKGQEDIERERLMPPAKLLTSRLPVNISMPSPFDADLDEDVPF